MSRLVIITVGKTHSGKTTFARALEQELHRSLVIDQDNHAAFINTYYRSLLPKHGPNHIKFAVTQTIVDYAVEQTDYHLILCNSNRSYRSRLDLLSRFHKDGFISVIVHLDPPDHVLQERVARSQRDTAIFRSATSFKEVLHRQQAETRNADVVLPSEGEANYLFHVTHPDGIRETIHGIIDLANLHLSPFDKAARKMQEQDGEL
ncbi:AAA family ATPase [Paenibacillus urinalis]|uniref:AAA family ATPase n=1 Tax=Paenibacillus urinalis TaxID=521520 RepID=A0ABY7X3W6_9BACL|nr:AAA family ATPase [Paenibacillus urinalis]WDH96899.1 AAA family ATPase [Paenibacillus urinalis]WDI00543.1 AAA family ATPase [Paenibacillus urinalis]